MRLLAHGVQRFFTRRAFKRLLLHHLQVALKHGQRGTQFVTDVGEEVATRPFQLVHLGDIARHHQPLLIAVGHHADLQMATVIELEIVRTGKITLFQVQRKLGITQKVEDILAIIVRPAQAQQLLRQAVTPEDRPFFGGQNHGIRQRLCAAAKTLNQASQLAATLFITHLHLMQSVQQRLPAAASRRRRHTSVNPQPPGEAQQVPEMPDQQPGDRRQQKPRQMSKKGPQNEGRNTA